MGAESPSPAVWGTWEDLILGGAVVRHGTGGWNVVASELRARTLYPYAFTPQACKERYEDLQKRYSGSTAWFEELKMRRVAELKRELVKSENSIGTLELKIKSLEGKKQQSKQGESGSSETESPPPVLDSEATESISRQTSNGENSVGSFTKETSTMGSWLCDHQLQAEETETKPSTSACSELGKYPSIDDLPEVGYEHGVIVRKKRGKRKRKDCSQVAKERSVDDNDNLGSSNAVSTANKETSTNECKRMRISSSKTTGRESLIEIFESIARSESAAVFRHRMDSQKRARYRRVIRQHMDIGTIKSRIVGQSIKTAKELFRDLLLLANNALVFYSRRTREYKAAIILRQLVMKDYKLHCRGYCNEATSDFIPCNPPVRPRTVRPQPRAPAYKDKEATSEKASKPENAALATPVGSRKQCNSGNSVLKQSLLKAKKGLKRPAKLKTELGDPHRKNTPVKQRKRVRR
ncbi:uncharacterized protein LOC121808154 isoform X2 [Salvia splendens]|uniref:uncharacterized protein LOC121808154 isoform X2 n=1 Tax=Salvia splendens TaxID=180675 RepID=UPI001C27DEF5|nr:uncharacterized protein LOC121808154 isoform X2 [Salvia splendens]